MLYFALFIVFLALIVAPVVVGPKLSGLMKTLDKTIGSGAKGIMDLLQPTGLNNNDTSSQITGPNIVPNLGSTHTGINLSVRMAAPTQLL